MACELLLTFADKNGERRRVAVSGERFSIGRSPENDLQISNHSLSRRHIEIQRFADVFVLKDAGSSNGTTINGETVTEPIALKNGDLLTLGGAVEIEVEIVGNEIETSQTVNAFNAENKNVSSAQFEESVPIWKNVFLIAPLAGCLVLLFVGALLFAFSGTGKTESNEQPGQNFPVNNRRGISIENDEEEPEETPSPRVSSNESTIISNSVEPEEKPSPENQSSELNKTEKYALQFLRRVSSDTQALLTAKQLELVSAKIKKYKTSAAVRENLRTARKNSGTIKSAAEKENLNPDFLTVAALAKLNETRGDPGQTAAVMAEDIGKLSRVLGTELANDCLIVVAAYEEGGSTLAMRDKLQNLTAKTPHVSPAIVRTVWFLKENGKVSDSAFDLVLRFLAIGTIAQNPREFGVE
ncbi:MAG: FHA domain-containing protein [Acidobacteriota bacterium]|nr:FHA domain-containing protein [Acidobacteriota bacterium]